MDPRLDTYFKAGLLKPDNNNHRRLAEVIGETARRAGIATEYIHATPLTPMLPTNSSLLGCIQRFPLLAKKGKKGIVIPDPLGEVANILPALVGAFTRNRTYARLVSISGALTELEATGKIVGDVLVLSDCENLELYATTAKGSYTKSTIDELISYCFNSGVFVILAETGDVDLFSCINVGSEQKIKTSYLVLRTL